MDGVKRRVAQAALNGAVAAIQQEFPMHRVQKIDIEDLSVQVRLSHPTAQDEGPRYFRVKISEPI
jgi:hypothetical protein